MQTQLSGNPDFEVQHTALGDINRLELYFFLSPLEQSDSFISDWSGQ